MPSATSPARPRREVGHLGHSPFQNGRATATSAIKSLAKPLPMSRVSVLSLDRRERGETDRDLRQSGLLKVKNGMTSLEEIEAITNE